MADIPLIPESIFSQLQATEEKAPTTQQNGGVSVPPTNSTQSQTIQQATVQPANVQTPPVASYTNVTPKVTITSRPGNVAHLSIRGAMQKQEEEKKKEEEKLAAISANTPFNQEQMIRIWNKYITTITEKTILKNTMETCKPILQENYKLIQSVENTYQQNEMMAELISLLNFLRIELRNGKIELEIRVKEVSENIHVLTPNERFKKLLETYPELAQLKDEMGLEIQLN